MPWWMMTLDPSLLTRLPSFARRGRLAPREHYAAEGEGGGAGGGNPPPTDPSKGGGTPPPEMIPKTEADLAYKARDKAKAQLRAGLAQFADILGVEATDVAIVETGDKDTPYRYEVAGVSVEEVKTTLADARKSKKAGAKWEDREKELQTAHQRQLQNAAVKHAKETEARDRWIDETAAVLPIRLACAAEKAIDADSSGNYQEVVDLLTDPRHPRVKVEKTFDEEQGRFTVKVTPLGEDGTPMLDSKGQPAEIRKLVAEFLNKRPHLKQAQYRGGPGAGLPGSGSGQGNGAGNNGRPSNSAGFMFGLRPQ